MNHPGYETEKRKPTARKRKIYAKRLAEKEGRVWVPPKVLASTKIKSEERANTIFRHILEHTSNPVSGISCPEGATLKEKIDYFRHSYLCDHHLPIAYCQPCWGKKSSIVRHRQKKALAKHYERVEL